VPFIIEHMISMASKLKTASEHRLHSFHKNYKNFGFLC